MKQKTIILPENLAERRNLLEAELSAVVQVQLEEYLQSELKDELNKAGFTEGTATLEWEFHGEYDDEGGTDYMPSGISLVVNGESVDMEDVEYTKVSSYSGGEYETYLYDNIYDIVGCHSGDLYEEYITEVTITLH